MEDYNCSSFNYSNSTWDYDYCIYLDKVYLIDKVMDSLIVSCGVPVSAVAVYGLYSLVRHDRTPALVYIINLLISDILQICSLIVTIRPFDDLRKLYSLLDHIHSFCVLMSVAFMACIALERYLLVAWPLWYRFKRPILISVVVSVLVWIFCLVVIVVLYFHASVYTLTILSILLLLPFPLFIFCLGGSLRALSSCRLSADEKRRIVAVLVLVLLIYTLLFLPAIINLLAGTKLIFYNLPFLLLQLNPLADLVLYTFMQKGAVDKLMASVCCCKLNNNDSSILRV